MEMVKPSNTVLRPSPTASEKGLLVLDQILEAESTGTQAPGVCTRETARLMGKAFTPQVQMP